MTHAVAQLLELALRMMVQDSTAVRLAAQDWEMLRMWNGDYVKWGTRKGKAKNPRIHCRAMMMTMASVSHDSH
jgi:hypothetical protein